MRNRIMEQNHGTRSKIHLSVTDSENNTTTPTINKGMVFSKSFEYDNRKAGGLNQNFSKSFDFDFEQNKSKQNSHLLSQYGKGQTFGGLTGISPNYLTKKDPAPISIFPKAIPGNKLNIGSLYPNSSGIDPSSRLQGKFNTKNVDDNRSRRSQFTRMPDEQAQGFRSFDKGYNNRLNSCDSGARSGSLNCILYFNLVLNQILYRLFKR